MLVTCLSQACAKAKPMQSLSLCKVMGISCSMAMMIQSTSLNVTPVNLSIRLSLGGHQVSVTATDCNGIVTTWLRPC